MTGPLRDLGPCKITFNGVDLGPKLKASFKFSQDSAPVHDSEHGTAPVDKIFTGDNVTVEVELTRTALATLISLTPGASGSGSSGHFMAAKSSVGISQYDRAKALVLTPYLGQTPSTKEYLTIWKASPQMDWDVVFDAEGQRVYKVLFTGFPVETTVSGGPYAGYLFQIHKDAS